MQTLLKLTCDLVPRPCWWGSLRDNTSRANWDNIRMQTYADYNHRCGICGDTPKRLEAHEIWEYDESNYTQTLKGTIALCPMCHCIKHYGLTTIKIDQGLINPKDVGTHFLSVNQCSNQVFHDHVKEAFEEWDRRSQYTWVVNWGKYSSFVNKAGG
jgi:hypothetical protein